MGIRGRDFFRWLDKFMGGRKEPPAKDIFCKN